MDLLHYNLGVLQKMKDGDVADFQDNSYFSVRKEEDGFYSVSPSTGDYITNYKHKSIMQLGPFFNAYKLMIRNPGA